ncbi:hypothetical protein DsansV1_C01g0007831 [Dioscorea sansibarensis]
MRAFDELRKVEMFFKKETKRGCPMIDLYELRHGKVLMRAAVGAGEQSS